MVKISDVPIKANNFFQDFLKRAKRHSPRKGCNMSTVPSPESLKEKAKLVRKFLKEKCNVDVSHSHCIEIVSQVFGFKDWNTASATLRSRSQKLPFKIETVSDMKRALEFFDDSIPIDGTYVFKVRELINRLEDYDSSDDEITQQFSLVLEQQDDEFASFKLELDYEDIMSSDGMQGRTLK